MSSNNLALTQVAENQTDKYLAINTAIAELANAVASQLDVDLSAGNGSLTNTQWRRNFAFNVDTGSGSVELTVPTIAKFAFFKNVGYGAVDVKVGTGTIQIVGGESALVWVDGSTDGIEVIGGGAGGGSFVGLTDTPSSYVDMALYLLRVNAATDAVEFVAPAYDVSFYAAGLILTSETVLTLVTTRNFTLPADLTGSKGKVDIAPTSDVQFIIRKNASDIGTINVAASTGAVTFTFSSQVSFATSTPDVLTVVAPETMDYDLEGLAVTLLGARSS